MLAQLSKNGSRFIDLLDLSVMPLEGKRVHYRSCNEGSIVPMSSVEISTIKNPHSIVSVVRQ